MVSGRQQQQAAATANVRIGRREGGKEQGEDEKMDEGGAIAELSRHIHASMLSFTTTYAWNHITSIIVVSRCRTKRKKRNSKLRR